MLPKVVSTQTSEKTGLRIVSEEKLLLLIAES